MKPNPTEKLSEIHNQILQGLSHLEEATLEEIAIFINQRKERIWRRISELHKKGLIYKTGNKRVLKTGRLGGTWRLIQTAIPNTKTSEKMLKGDSIVDYSRNILRISKSVLVK